MKHNSKKYGLLSSSKFRQIQKENEKKMEELRRSLFNHEEEVEHSIQLSNEIHQEKQPEIRVINQLLQEDTERIHPKQEKQNFLTKDPRVSSINLVINTQIEKAMQAQTNNMNLQGLIKCIDELMLRRLDQVLEGQCAFRGLVSKQTLEKMQAAKFFVNNKVSSTI